MIFMQALFLIKKEIEFQADKENNLISYLVM